MSKDRLQKAFQYVREIFFPTWDKKNEWKVEYMPEFKKWHEKDVTELIKHLGLEDRYPFKLNIYAICQDFRQCILFYRIPKNINALHKLLIHEICHINAPGHGKKWARNMNRAYIKAQRNPDVSPELMMEIDFDIDEFYDERLS